MVGTVAMRQQFAGFSPVETIYHHYIPAVDMANAIVQACRPEIGMHDELALTCRCRISLQTKSPSPQYLLRHLC